jgi:hypothetical protein
MNAPAPPKKAPGAGELTGRKLIASSRYAALVLLANLFGAAFWFFEQRRWRLADRVENESAGQ